MVETNVMVTNYDHELGVTLVAEDVFEAPDVILPVLIRKCQSAKQENVFSYSTPTLLLVYQTVPHSAGSLVNGSRLTTFSWKPVVLLYLLSELTLVAGCEVGF